jgi:hypothetical protein
VLVLGSGGRTMEVLLDPLLVVRYWALDLRLPSGGALLPVFALVWAVESLGLRAAGLREAARALRGGSAGRAMLAATALCGWPLGLLLRISPAEATSRERPFNEALYFFEQSGPLLWLFAAAALAGLRLRRPAAALLACACAGLALPGTVAWAASEWRRPPGRLNAPVVQAMDALARASAPGDVVLMRPELQRFPPPPLVLAGRRVPLSFYVTFLNQFVEQRARRARLEEVRAFFATADPGRARAVARGLGAGYVCFFGVDGPAFDTRAAGLEAIFEAATVRVYRLGSGP